MTEQLNSAANGATIALPIPFRSAARDCVSTAPLGSTRVVGPSTRGSTPGSTGRAFPSEQGIQSAGYQNPLTGPGSPRTSSQRPEDSSVPSPSSSPGLRDPHRSSSSSAKRRAAPAVGVDPLATFHPRVAPSCLRCPSNRERPASWTTPATSAEPTSPAATRTSATLPATNRSRSPSSCASETAPLSRPLRGSLESPNRRGDTCPPRSPTSLPPQFQTNAIVIAVRVGVVGALRVVDDRRGPAR